MRIPKYTTIGGIRPYGASLEVHWSVFVVSGILLLGGIASPLRSLLAVVSYLSIILVHEIGHAAMAKSIGCRVHSIRLGFFHGSCAFDVPYDVWDHIKIAWAGSLAQLALAMPVYSPIALIPPMASGVYASVFIFLVYFNILFALMNLAPARGLDGRLAWQVIPLIRQRWQAKAASKKALKDIFKE